MSRPIVFLDLYCGAGGYSTGFAEAMRDLGLPYYEVAVNHWERAIETMQTNHPDVIAMQVDISAVNPCDIDADVIDLLHASPSCTHHSRAKGGKPRDNQLRSQPNEIWKFVDNKHVRRITIENVPEFTNWGPLTVDGRPIKRKEGECFRAWLQQFTARGYTYEWRILNCADYGDATSRRRFFLQAVKRGCGKIRWPEPTHSENPQPDMFGRDLKKWRGVRECLDLSDLGTSIFNRDHPLSRNTLRRVAVGMSKYNGMDFLMDMPGADGDDDSWVHPLAEPMPTQYAGGNRCAVMRPFIVKLKKNCWAEDIDSPLSTATTKESHALCQPFIVKLNNHADAENVEKPLTSVLAGGQHHALCQPILIDHFFDKAVGLPRLPDGRYIDILLRMLRPSELAAAHSFPKDYKLSGNRADQVKQIGNSIPVQTAKAIVKAMFERAK